MTAILRKVEKTFTFEDQRVEVNELAWDVYNLSLGNAKLTDFSVVVNANSGTGDLTFDDTTGEFEYTPPDLSQFLTSYTETDPVFVASVAYNITPQNITDWINAHSWGNHALEGYIKGIGAISLGALSDVDTTTNAPAAKDHLVFDGTNWVPTSPEANVFISDAPPANPDVGDLWYESDKGALKIYYEDADSSQWVDANVLPISSGAGITLTDLSVITDNPLGGGGLVYDNTSGEFTFTPANVLSLSDFSVTTATPSGGGSLTYLTGTFTYTPPDLSTYLELTDLSVNVASPNGNGTLTYSDTTGVFTYTPPDLSSGTSRYSLPVATTTVLGGVKIDGTTITINNGTISATSSGGGSTNVSIGTTAPTNATAGDLWWNSTQGQLKIYYNDGNSSQWVDACGPNGTSSSGGASVTVSDTAPTNPSGGDLWWNSSQGQLKIYYSDANSSQWVDTAGGGGGTISSLNDIGDVNVGTVITGGHVLKWDDQNDEWIAGPDSTSSGGSGIALTDISVTKPNPAASGSGDVTYNSTSGALTYTPPDLSSFSTFSGSYTDLTNKPTIPAAQVKADWNATTGLAEILNKPNIPGSYSLPVATTTVLGGVKIDGTSITISNGVISSSGGTPATQDLQDVTDEGKTTTNDITAAGFTSNGDVIIDYDSSASNSSGDIKFKDSSTVKLTISSKLESINSGNNWISRVKSDSIGAPLVITGGKGAYNNSGAATIIGFNGGFAGDIPHLIGLDDDYNYLTELYGGGQKVFTTQPDGVQPIGALYDKDDEKGTAGQILSSTGTALDWIDPPTGGNGIVSANVKDFGALGDNATDDTAAIQAAINSLLNGSVGDGGVVYLPPGVYRISAPITFGSTAYSITLKGSTTHFPVGTFGGSIIRNTGSGNAIEITNSMSITITNLGIDHTSSSGGTAISATSTGSKQGITVDQVYILDHSKGIDLIGYANSIIRNTEIRDQPDDANSTHAILLKKGTDGRQDQLRLENVIVEGETPAGSGVPHSHSVGLKVEDWTNSIWVKDCAFLRMTQGIYYDQSVQGRIAEAGAFHRIENSDVDHCRANGMFFDGGYAIWVQNCYIGSNGYPSGSNQQSGLVTGENFRGTLWVNNADCRGNSKYGLAFNNNHTKIHINSCHCGDNGAAQPSSSAGIYAIDGANDITIIGGQCGGDNYGHHTNSGNQQNGIHFQGDNHQRININAVDTTCNAGPSIVFANSGTNINASSENFIQNCPGFNSGGQTSFP